MTRAALQAVYVNDRPDADALGASLEGVVARLGLGGKRGVAVAVNGAVVPRAEWPARLLAAGDRVLVIRATQGG